MTPQERQNIEELFRSGIIGPWALFPFQMEPYDTIRTNRFPFIEQSRRTGKTNEVLCYVMEELLKNEGWICRWCEPWKFQAREIIMPEIERIQSYAAPRDRFRYYTTDSFYENRNGSRLYLRGVNDDKGESARGPKSHIIVADEYGSWRDARYIVNEVLLPQLLSTNGPLIKLSTPPKDLGHKYYDDRERAQRLGRFCQRTIWDSLGQLYSQQQIEDICEEVGGVDSIAWRREFLCEDVGDPGLLVVPEFQEAMKDVVFEEIDKPSHSIKYTGGDSGHDDFTFYLFGYHDFINDIVIIEREYVANHKTTRQHITEAKKIEAELWGEQKPYRRVLDADKQLTYDIASEYDFSIVRPDKKNKIASINSLRDRVQRRKVKVHSSCVNLIRQLRVGMWKDEKHTDFQRTEGLGHLDGIAAMMYFNRSIIPKKNPFPVGHGYSRYTHHVPAELKKETRNEHEAFAGVFGRKK